jgi:hypothetical protein
MRNIAGGHSRGMGSRPVVILATWMLAHSRRWIALSAGCWRGTRLVRPAAAAVRSRSVGVISVGEPGCRAWCSKSPKPISERQADFVYVKGTPGVPQIARRREQSAFGASR